MHRFPVVSVFMFSFGLGCVTAGLAPVYGPLLVPPARAASGPQNKWEQTCVPFRDHIRNTDNAKTPVLFINDPESGWNRVLKEYGQQGWELVSVGFYGAGGDIGAVCFKRPIPG